MNERLFAISERCWSWLAAHLEYFSFDTPLTERRGLCMTALMELMLFTTAARRASARGAHLDTIAARVRSEIARYDWESSLIGDPGFVVAVLTVIEFLESDGADATALRALIPGALAPLASADLIPYRRLEIERLLVRMGFAEVSSGRFDALACESVRMLRKPLALYSREQRFALAHIMFYLCDDGAVDPSGIRVVDAAWLAARARVCAHLCLVDRETDMLGEFILACSYLGALDNLLLDGALTVLETLQTPDGAIPNDPPAGPFIGSYHATLIWAYAGTALQAEPLCRV